jgi:hypothetical protein
MNQKKNKTLRTALKAQGLSFRTGGAGKGGRT